MRPRCPLLTLLWVMYMCGVRAATDSPVAVKTKNGPIIGEKRGHFYAFEGIPYAKPPTGELRYAPPVLNDEKWKAPRNTTSFGSVCMQWDHLVPDEDKLVGSEDCLFLNVYTTSVQKNGEKLPTVFFIHGGAFMFGAGSFYGPENLLQKPMILVTFNYRVGPLGFLSTEDDVIPGNYGLKDQSVALQWVKKNIKYFGGDAGMVTIVGYSAGSASVHLHYLSPMSRGLFQAGIGHSGAALNPWVMAEHSAEKAKKIATAVGCPTATSEQMLQCLRGRPAEDIVRQMATLLDFLYNPFSPLGVVVEKQSKRNGRPFLTEHPRTLMKKGQFMKVPLILSITQAEGLYPGAEFISNPQYLKDIDERWNELIPSILDYKSAVQDPTQRDQLSAAIRRRYLGENKLSAENFRDFIRMISNRLYFVGVTETAKLMQPHTPIYYYYDLYKASYALGEALSHSTENYGVAHGEDVLLIFPTSVRPDMPYTNEELEVIRKFVEMYDMFARGQPPTFGDFELPSHTSETALQYLLLNHPISEAKTADGVDDEAFWMSLDFGDQTSVPANGQQVPAAKTEL